MDSARWQRLREIFQAALEREPDDWPAFVGTACDGDPALRAEVESLLASHRRADGFLADGQSASALFLEGTRIGPYRAVHKLGSGGMGVVYLALRADDEFQQRVALKVIKPGLDSEEIIHRFRMERQILAALDHPNIARLLDGGTTDRGLPYFAMEHVEGQALDVYCEENGLGVAARLELFRTVCSAVQFAHAHLVVHRDLKPGNILVTADGTPKLLDFGIAKLLDPEVSAQSAPTALACRPMTPDYASPEQVRGEPITTASDVFSLGVLLYELLTGDHPYRRWGSSPEEMRRRITEEEPERPSATLPRAGRKLDEDLDNIVLMALRKEPRLRYGSVEQLAEDVRHYLVGLPVLARRGTWTYRLGKLVRRHRAGVAAAAALTLAILGFGAAMGVLAARLSRERGRAEQVTAFLTGIFEVSDPLKATGETITAREILDTGARKLSAGLERQPEVQADLMRTVGLIYRKLGLFDRAAPLLESALARRRALLGGEDPKVAESLNDLALLHEDEGAYAEAERLYRQALSMRRELFGAEHPDVAQSLSDLAGVLWATGRYEEAEVAYREVLALRRRLYGDRHLDVAKSLNNLGIVLWTRGSYGEAEKALREALELRRTLFGRETMEVADNLNNLALVVQASGDDAGSEALYREALGLWSKLLGRKHPRVATGLNNLGQALQDQGKYTAAEPLLAEALALRRELLGNEHPETAQSLENLGFVAQARGELATAEGFLGEALAIRRKLFGAEHPAMAATLQLQGLTRQGEGDLAGAEALFRQALAMDRKLLGDDHPRVATVLTDLAALLVEKGEFTAAEAAVRESLPILRRALPHGGWEIAEAESVLGRCLVQSGRYQEAEALLLRSYEMLKTARGESAPPTRMALASLVALRQTQRRR